MSIKQFELFHGVVLTKLVRSEKPVSVSLIETRPTEDWQVYGIIDVDLFVKHRASFTALHRGKGGRSWQFIFSPKEISRINKKDRPLHVALVCGGHSIQDEMEICFLKPEQAGAIFPSDESKTFSLTVKSEPNKGLRVIVDRKLKDIIARNAIDKWEIPGR